MLIDIKLDKDFSNEFKKLSAEYGEAFDKLNGFHDSQLNYTGFIDNFIDKQTVADASIDSNANVGSKDIVSLMNEMSKPHMKLLSFNKIFYEMKKKYGLTRAREWLRAEWSGDFYLHDAFSSTWVPYCYAYDLTKLANEGLFFIKQFNNRPPKHLTTFMDFVGEYISYACNRTSGAVGLPDLVYWMYYFWKTDVANGYYIKTPELYFKQEVQRIVYKMNQPYFRSGIQSAFTNVSIFDKEYLMAIFGGREFPDGTLAIDQIDELKQAQQWFMEQVSIIRTENMMTFPVLTFALIYKDGEFADEEFARWANKHNMKWGDSNFFFSQDVASLSNCCRLKSNIKDLGFFNSIGGTALSVGSVKVNTINLARISYMNVNEAGYLQQLKEKVILCLESLDTIRSIITRNKEKGLLPNYDEGLIDMSKQYNTIGINGLYEALEGFSLIKTDEFGYKKYTEEGLEFAKLILETITKVKSEWLEANKKDYMVNIEQVPAERCAFILQQKDKLLFPNEKYGLPLYGNQWIPLGVKTSIYDKMSITAPLDNSCSGGAISHINIEAPFASEEQAWDTLNAIAQTGIEYFAFNLRISSCKHNHGFYGNVCPECGEPVETTYQRIVGFLTPTKSYSKERKEEFAKRDWFSLQQMSEL